MINTKQDGKIDNSMLENRSMSNYENRFLKYRMEQAWATRGCVCPSHVASWSTFERGYRFYNLEMTDILLWYKKGRILGPKRTKPKGKGFSYLCKFYHLAWEMKKTEVGAKDE